MSQRSETYGRYGEISRRAKFGQVRMLELAEQAGFSAKVIELETGIPASTIRSWKAGTSMSLDAFAALAAIKAFPDDLLSLPFEAAGKAICDDAPADSDIDDLAQAAVDLLARYVAARHPDSPGGIKIAHNEKDALRQSAKAIGLESGKVAA
jgi:hypothetical protein